jgi:mono/diheme cytochrome c family protein
VVTYALKAKQYVAFTSGNISRSVFGAVGIPTIVIMALDEQTAARAAAGPQPPYDIERGRELYAQNCSACHGATGEGGTGKSLKSLSGRLTFDATVQWLENPKPPMPKLFPNPLSEEAVRDIAAFIRTF